MAISFRSRLEKLERKPGRQRPPVDLADLARSLKQELLAVEASPLNPKTMAANEILRVAADAGQLRDLSDMALDLLHALLEARYASLSIGSTS